MKNMERFYERHLFGFAYGHSGYMKIAKRFLCLNWKTVNKDSIQSTTVENEYLVLNVNKESDLIYIINSAIGIYNCPVRISETLYKYQGVIIAKYHIRTINFLPSLLSDDHIIFSFITSSKYKIFFYYKGRKD